MHDTIFMYCDKAYLGSSALYLTCGNQTKVAACHNSAYATLC